MSWSSRYEYMLHASANLSEGIISSTIFSLPLKHCTYTDDIQMTYQHAIVALPILLRVMRWIAFIWKRRKSHKNIYIEDTLAYQNQNRFELLFGNMSSFYAKLWAYIHKEISIDMKKLLCINLEFLPSHWAYLLRCQSGMKTLKKGYAFGIIWFIGRMLHISKIYAPRGVIYVTIFCSFEIDICVCLEWVMKVNINEYWDWVYL